MAKDKAPKRTRISLAGYRDDKGIKLKRLPQEPSRLDAAFWSENGGLDDFRQVGWISMNTGEVWGLAETAPELVPDMTPILINVRGD